VNFGRLVATTPRRWLRGPTNGTGPDRAGEFWALKDVSFEVKRGEVVGVIGRNGAGKSTLLKVLSRITEPTAGRFGLRGRVGSLLEVGTGFHGELTGRENVFLSGTLLGMTRREVQRKLDAIVAFAEVDDFLVLVVDEVLAVGDAAFQKKCLGKMGEVAAEGRTVLFVSHNTIAVRSLCGRAVWLDAGEVRATGPAGEILRHYLDAIRRETLGEGAVRREYDAGDVRLCSVRVRPADGADAITVDTPLEVVTEAWNGVPGRTFNVTLKLYDDTGACALHTFSDPGPVPAGDLRATCRIPGGLLNDRSYRVEVFLVEDAHRVLLRVEDVTTFEVADVPRTVNWYGRIDGVVRPRLAWQWDPA
jgi:lipopolysaccharide transport system ATP-binding protein